MRTAKTRLATLDASLPYKSHFDYVADLAALASLHKKEVNVKPLGSTNTVLHKLWLATAPLTIGYYFNNMLRESMLPECQRGQLSSGTASNGCLNAEINGVFRNVNGMYQATLKLECEAFRIHFDGH